MRKLEAVSSDRGKRVLIKTLLSRAEIYVRRAERLALLKLVPAMIALISAGIGVLTIGSIAKPNASVPVLKAVEYVLVWTALSTVVMVYAFLGAAGSKKVLPSDRDGFDPAIPIVTISWRYVELLAVLVMVALLGVGVLHRI